MVNEVNYVYRSGRLDLEAKTISDMQQLISKVVAATEKRSVSVIVPTYNEVGNIGRLIDELFLSFEKSNIKGFEIIVVDDDSKDSTPLIIDKYSKAGNVAALHRYGVRGIFSAIMDGVKAARSDVVVMMDADFSHPP